MPLDNEFLKQVIETFKAELDENLQVITDGLLALEKQNNNPEELEKIIVGLFRSAHNIKGSSRGVGVLDVGEIAHHLETLFTAIQNKKVDITPEIITLCLQATDCMRDAMQAFSVKEPIQFNLSDLLSRLKNIAHATSAIQKEVPPAATIPAVGAPTTHSEEPTVSPKKTNKSGQFESIRVSIHSLDLVSAYVEEMQLQKIAIDDYYNELVQLNGRTKQFIRSWKRTLLDAKALYSRELGEDFQKIYDSNVDRLTDIGTTINKMRKDMNFRINELRVLSNALQEEVRMLRLVPAANLLRELPRAVRDIANKLNKPVALKIIDHDSRIDKMVLEGLKDPIMHIIRNAIDHGIESLELRKETNKSETALITIETIEEGNQIIFKITDDGTGIDSLKVSETALRKNIISRSVLESMKQEDVINLIFRPGFSTKELVTDISGRGVGLDVVKANLANLKGDVHVTTEIGKGTTFHLRVPLNLSTERGLMVQSSGQLFVITTGSVERVLTLAKSDILEIEGSQAIMLDEHPVSLRVLSDILNLDRNEDLGFHDYVLVVVIKRGLHIIALLVEEIIGEREIVIKPLQAPLINLPCVSGATISGTGQIILVLNSRDLLEKALTLTDRKGFVARDARAEAGAKGSILVVDDSITTRNFIQNILKEKGYNVVTAADGQIAWDLLQNEPFSLVITDVEMPRMNGYELTDHIKRSRSLHAIPVIIVTSLMTEEQKRRGMEVGANAYVVKGGFNSAALLEVISKLV